MNAKRRPFLLLAAAATMLLASVGQVWADDFPGSKPDRRIIKTQQQVDELFEKGDYERAYFIYRNELAPLGDKYAQYMVGYMSIVGKGVVRDYIAGSAWYRLAAERGDENFTRARDEVLQLFNDEQRMQSDKKYAELRLLFSDAMIVVKLIEQDLDIVEDRVPGNTLTYSPADITAISNANRAKLADEAKDRIADRIQFLQEAAAVTEAMSAEEKARIEQALQRAQMQGIEPKRRSTRRASFPSFDDEQNYLSGRNPPDKISGNDDRTREAAPASP